MLRIQNSVRTEFPSLKWRKNLKLRKKYAMFIWVFGQDHKKLT
jgi:hypothetical protein